MIAVLGEKCKERFAGKAGMRLVGAGLSTVFAGNGF